MSCPLKILHIISSWERGAGNELAELTRRLDQNQFESEICVLAELGRRWTYDVSTYFGLGRTLRRFRPDIVHAWDNIAHAYATLHFGTQRIFAEKNEIDQPKGLVQHYLNRNTSRFIVSQPNAWIPTTKAVVIPPAAVPMPCAKPITTEELLHKLGFPLVEPSGDYYPVFQPQYEPTRLTYKSTNAPQTPFLIGIVLPLRSEHRILDALWVFETLNHVHLNFHALIIGSGRDQETFLRYRDRWKLSARVHFVGARQASHRLLPYVDVLLHLSSSAEYAGTVLTAMSCGVPVVALETPESRKYISDGITGLIIPAEGDFRFYRRTAVKRLLYLLENEDLRRSMQGAAKDRITKEFNFDTAVRRRSDAYLEAMF